MRLTKRVRKDEFLLDWKRYLISGGPMELPPPDLPPPVLPSPSGTQPRKLAEQASLDEPSGGRPPKVTLLERDPSLNSYRDLVLDAVSYPWRRGGAYILVPGTFLALAFAFGVWAPVIGLVSMGIGACFFSAFYLQIVESTIAGRHSLPDWPSFADFYDDMLKPGFQMAVVFVMSTLIYVAAAWGLSSVSISFTTEETQMAIWREVGQAVYSLYIPMAVMGLVLHGSAAGALPHRVIPAIMRCMPGYLGGVCIMALISLTTDWLRESARMIPYAGLPLAWLLTICLMVMQGRLTGTLGLRFARRITGA